MRIRSFLLFFLGVLLVLVVFFTLNSGADNNTMEFADKEDVSVAVTGDVMFARKMPGVLSLDSSPFKGVSDVTSAVDLLLINFENAATTSSNALKGDVPLKCDPVYVPLAKANNNTVASLANNHAFDYGITGMQDTLKALKDAGITPIGAGNNQKEATAPVTKNIKDRNISIVNYMDSNNFKEYSYEVMPYATSNHAGYSAYNSTVAKEDISILNTSDMVIAYLHFGNEYSRSPNEDQIKIAHELIDDGADAVVGSHPHVTQGIEMYKGKPIFYSLGNFIFDQSNEATHSAYFVKFDLINDTCEATVYPIYISNYLPQFMQKDSGEALLNSLNPQCENLTISEGVGKLTFKLGG